MVLVFGGRLFGSQQQGFGHHRCVTPLYGKSLLIFGILRKPLNNKYFSALA